ncbi:membrane protein [soil metagenome]
MNAKAQRSPAAKFIHGLAWGFVICGAAMLLYGLLPSGDDEMLETLTGMGLVDGSMVDAAMMHMPRSVRWLLDHPHWVDVSAAAVSALMLASGIGLHKRREWGRLSAIAVLVLVIAEHVIGALLVVDVTAALPAAVGQGDAEMRHLIESGMTAINAMTLLAAFLMCLLFAWLIWRLLSDPVREAFDSVD